jgi:hypothetical protein
MPHGDLAKTSTDELLLTGEAARRLRRSEQWTRNAADRGLIDCTRTAAGRLYSAASVAALAAQLDAKDAAK